MIVLSVLVPVLVYTSIGCYGFRYVVCFVVFVLIRVYVCLLNMDRNLHAAFWSDSPSPQENRYTITGFEFVNRAK